ncbi:MAG: hypothetical protein QW512_03490 [Thermofilaceae archaeon]
MAVEEMKKRYEELMEFVKLAPSPVTIVVNGKEYTIKPPSLWVVNEVERLLLERGFLFLSYLSGAEKKENGEVFLSPEKSVELFKKSTDLVVEIVLRIINGPSEKVVTKEELLKEWSVLDLVKVYKIYKEMVDLSGFFTEFPTLTIGK